MVVWGRTDTDAESNWESMWGCKLSGSNLNNLEGPASYIESRQQFVIMTTRTVSYRLSMQFSSCAILKKQSSDVGNVEHPLTIAVA